MSPLLKRVAEALAIVAAFTLAGVVGGLCWRAVVHLPTITRPAGGAHMDAVAITQIVDGDGWFAVIAGFFGIVLGIGVAVLRSQQPFLMVVSTAVGGFAAMEAMVGTIRLLIPDAATRELVLHKLGVRFPIQATGVEFFFPAAALFGVLLVLLVLPGRPLSSPATEGEQSPQPAETGSL